jgi:hypothetical protein
MNISTEISAKGGPKFAPFGHLLTHG